MIIDHRSWSTIFVVYVEMVISLIGLASSIWNRMFGCILDGLCLPCFLYLRYDLEVIDSLSYIKDWLGNFSLVLLAHHASCIMLVIRLVQTSFKNLFDTIHGDRPVGQDSEELRVIKFSQPILFYDFYPIRLQLTTTARFCKRTSPSLSNVYRQLPTLSSSPSSILNVEQTPSLKYSLNFGLFLNIHFLGLISGSLSHYLSLIWFFGSGPDRWIPSQNFEYHRAWVIQVPNLPWSG